MLKLHFLNVGKGSCTILDFPSERLSMIDIDDSRSISATERLLMEFTKKASLTNPIDYILSHFSNKEIFRFILTHPDMDHMSGIKLLFDKKDIWNFWDTANNRPNPGNWEDSPYDEEDWSFYQKIRENTEDPRTLILYRDAESKCCWIEDGVRILAPTRKIIEEANEKEDWDRLSYVLTIEYSGRKILLGGDATRETWEDIIRHCDKNYLKSDIFLAPHHGSENNISTGILDIIKPRLIIVSVAEGVNYDRDTYSKYGCVLSTKYYGNVEVRVKDNGEIILKTQFQNYSDDWYILKDRNSYYSE